MRSQAAIQSRSCLPLSLKPRRYHFCFLMFGESVFQSHQYAASTLYLLFLCVFSVLQCFRSSSIYLSLLVYLIFFSMNPSVFSSVYLLRLFTHSSSSLLCSVTCSIYLSCFLCTSVQASLNS